MAWARAVSGGANRVCGGRRSNSGEKRAKKRKDPMMAHGMRCFRPFSLKGIPGEREAYWADNRPRSPPGELRIIFPRTFLYLLDGLLLALLPMGTVFVDSADMEDSLMRMLSITSADASNGLIMRHGGPASSRIATQNLFTSRGLSNAESTARPGKGDYSAAFWVSTRNGWAG